jgi:hypothetical protein
VALECAVLRKDNEAALYDFYPRTPASTGTLQDKPLKHRARPVARIRLQKRVGKKKRVAGEFSFKYKTD